MQLKFKRRDGRGGGSSPFFSRQMLLSPGTPRRTISEEIQTGYFYEINHAMLSANCPEQLKSIRVVMVSDKNEDSISLRFPSLYSLRKQLKNSSHGMEEKMHPALDEKYVMCYEAACGILSRRISYREFAERSHTWSFWVADGYISSSSMPFSPVPVRAIMSNKGSLLSELKYSGMVKWGKKRRVRFLSRHEDNKNSYNLNLLSLTARDDDNQEHDLEMEMTESKKEYRKVRMMLPRVSNYGLKKEEEEKEEEEDQEQQEDINDGDDDEAEIEEEQEDQRCLIEELPRTRSKTRKRKSCNRNTTSTTSRALTIRRGTSDSTRMQIIPYKKKRKVANHIDRWSAERYNMAEENMLKILKENGAVYGNPILRPALRAEARKLIGDTGLLDHLLKHMAGKVAPGGKDRFRRRHNADGAMEYWLESADLEKLREEAGVEDPYWTPPPGWQLGDSPSQDPVCAKEIKFIKEEILLLKSQMQELQCSRNREGDISKTTNTPLPLTNFNLKLQIADHLLLPLQEMYAELTKKKSEADERLQEITRFLDGMQLIREDMERLVSILGEPKRSGHTKQEGTTTLSEITTTSTAEVREEDKREAAAAAAEYGYSVQREVVNVSVNVNVSGEKDDEKKNVGVTETSRAASFAEEKGARIERMKKSGFRICRPQGSFLWPNRNSSSRRSQLSDSPAAAAGVEEVLVASTAPSVTSSILLQEEFRPELTSPVKPFAEKQPLVESAPPPPPPPSSDDDHITLAQEKKTKINLNDFLNNHNPSSSTASITYRRRSSSNTAVTGFRIPTPTPSPQSQPQQVKGEVEGLSSCSSSSPWLALATPSPPDA